MAGSARQATGELLPPVASVLFGTTLNNHHSEASQQISCSFHERSAGPPFKTHRERKQTAAVSACAVIVLDHSV